MGLADHAQANAEAAADRGLHQANAGQRQLEQFSNQHLHGLGHLGGGPDVQPAALIIVGHVGVILHLALLLFGNVEGVFDNVVALGEQLLGGFAVLVVPAVALAGEEGLGQVKGQIARLERREQVTVLLLALGLGSLRGHENRQGLIGDLDLVCSALCCLFGLCDYAADGVALVLHDFVEDVQVRDFAEYFAEKLGHQQFHNGRVIGLFRDIIGADDFHDAGHLQRLGEVELLHFRVSMLPAANYLAVIHAGHAYIAGIDGLTGYLFTGINLGDSFSNNGFCHAVPPFLLLAGGCYFTSHLNSFDDFYISGAAADIAFQTTANFIFRGLWVLLKNGDSLENHARRAEAALNSTFVDKGFLNGMQLAVLGKTCNSDNVFAIHGSGKSHACKNSFLLCLLGGAVCCGCVYRFAFRAAFFHQQHGAGAALAPAAAVFNVSQVQLVPDDLKKGIMNGYVQIILLPIYIKGYCAFFHDVYLLTFLL